MDVAADVSGAVRELEVMPVALDSVVQSRRAKALGVVTKGLREVRGLSRRATFRWRHLRAGVLIFQESQEQGRVLDSQSRNQESETAHLATYEGYLMPSHKMKDLERNMLDTSNTFDVLLNNHR